MITRCSFNVRTLRFAGGCFALAMSCSHLARQSVAQDAPETQTARMYIREYRVVGSKTLPRIEVEEAVYPFLGPGRTFNDIEQARAALEKAYHDQGFKTAQVGIPDQSGRGGIVKLEVHEGKVGSLRVKGAKYFLPSSIKKKAQSLAEGKVINFNDVTREIISLNQLPDRRVEPRLTPRTKMLADGTEALDPGIFDIELIVKDSLPLHGSAELNNRNSPNTTDLRLNMALSHGNLWQLGHSIGASYQMSPEDTSEVKVFSGFYMIRFPGMDSFSLMLTGTKQDSNVSTLGGVAVSGRGEILGLRGIFVLPTKEGFFQSFSAGIDYKNFDQAVQIGLSNDVTPISYYPISATWDGTWIHTKEINGKRRETGTTTMTAGVTAGLRGSGSKQSSLERNRFGADGNFIYFRGDLAHTQKLPGDWELHGKVQGQAADQPLVNSEQFGGGGLGTARGYLEAEVVGDNAVFGTVELRTPSLLKMKRTVKKIENGAEVEDEVSSGNEWRFFAFGDAGTITLHDTLPGQDSSFRLASVGLGSELQFAEHFHGRVELALPLTTLGTTSAHDARVSFRLWADF